MPDACLICREQRGDVELPGGPLSQSELVFAFHVPPTEENPRPFLGHLLLTPRRHIAGLEDLRDDEGAAIGVATAKLARSLRETLDLERIYSMVVGHHVPHLHFHLFPRYRGTPDHVRWTDVDDWEGSPHGGPPEIEALVGRLQAKMNG